MADYRIERDVVIEAPVDVVWRTVTEADQIARWFADQVELDLRPGGQGSFAFERDDGATHRAPLVVETVERPTRFAFRWSHPEGELPVDGNSVLVEFTLVPEGDRRTRLRVVERGLDTIGWPEEEKARYADDHRAGWAHFLGQLAALDASAGPDPETRPRGG